MSTHSIRKTVKTPKAAAYATQLSKHFGHKVDVEQIESGAIFHFSFGTGTAEVNGELLTLTATAETTEHLHKVATVLGAHLERFAFRENLQLGWPEPVTSIDGETS